jgi:hypothetical protein
MLPVYIVAVVNKLTKLFAMSAGLATSRSAAAAAASNEDDEQ